MSNDTQVAAHMALELFPLLCQAWGESDRPCAFIAYTEAEVRKFIVNEWWGDDTDERVDEVMSDLRGHDWKDEPEWSAEFEIGGVAFKPVYESNSRAAVESSARQLAEQPGFVMVPVEPTPAMLVAMWDHRESMRGQSENRIARAGYTAMLAARPLTAAPIPEAPALREAVKQEPVGFMSKEQLALIEDPEGEHGRYIPMRKTPAGNFTFALYTTPQAPKAEPVLLSDAEIRQWWSSENGLEDMDMCKIDDFTTVVRAIEQAIGRASRGAK